MMRWEYTCSYSVQYALFIYVSDTHNIVVNEAKRVSLTEGLYCGVYCLSISFVLPVFLFLKEI